MSANTLRRAAKVAKIDFVEMEFSPFETGIENSGVIDACKELGVKIFAYSPLGHGAFEIASLAALSSELIGSKGQVSSLDAFVASRMS